MDEKPTINDMMVAYAQDAVDYALQNFKITLDYSVESIDKIEAIAAQLHSTLQPGGLGKLFKKGPSAEQIDKICKMLGGYVGEVYRRQKGGEWGINDKFKAIGISRGGLWIFPPAKIHKRLTNGKEDDIWFYFRVLMNPPTAAQRTTGS